MLEASGTLMAPDTAAKPSWLSRSSTTSDYESMKEVTATTPCPVAGDCFHTECAEISKVQELYRTFTVLYRRLFK